MASRTGNLLERLPLLTMTVIGLIAIGSLLFGPFQGTLDIVFQDLSRILFGAAYAEAALNSAKAVSYASSCTALANLNQDGEEPDRLKDAWQQPATPNISTRCNQSVTGDPATFGQVRVTCDALNADDASCQIRGLKLPQNVPEVGWGTWIAGMGHPEYLLYYEGFPRGPEAAWQVHGENLGAIAVAAGAVLNVAFYGAASRISSSSSGLGDGIRGFLRNSDEGSSMFARVRKLGSALSPWRQFSRSTDDIARSSIASDIVRTVQHIGEGSADDIGDSALRGASDDLYAYFQRNSGLADDGLDSVRGDVQRILDDNGINPGAIDGMSGSRFNNVAEEMARGLQEAAEVRAGRVAVNAGDDTAEMSMRQYWQNKRVMDDVVDGLFDGSSNSLLRGKMDDFLQQTRGAVDDFVTLPSFTLRGVSRAQIRKRAMMLGCRSRLPRVLAHDAAESYFANNEDAQAIADAMYVGSISVSSICPGSDVATRQQLRGWGSAAIKGFAGATIAAGWASQKYLSDSQKYTSQGINSVAVKIPFVEPKVYDLHPYANYYFMNLKTGSFVSDSNRFYLVSPFTMRQTDLETDDPYAEIATTQLECRYGGGEATHRLRTQADWNNGQPNVGAAGACFGDLSDSNSCGDFGEDVCKSLPGCFWDATGSGWGGGTGGSCASADLADPEPSDIGIDTCDSISKDSVCSAVAGCSWDVVNQDRQLDFPADGWNNYIHVKKPVDPSQRDTMSRRVISADGYGKKFCAHSGIIDDITFWTPDPYNVESLEFETHNMAWETTEGEHNYGWDSADLDALGAKALVTIVAVALEFVSGPVPTTAVLVTTGAAEVVIFDSIDRENAWPEH